MLFGDLLNLFQGFCIQKEAFGDNSSHLCSYISFYFGLYGSKVVELVPLRRRYQNVWGSQGCRMGFANSDSLSSIVNFEY